MSNKDCEFIHLNGKIAVGRSRSEGPVPEATRRTSDLQMLAFLPALPFVLFAAETLAYRVFYHHEHGELPVASLRAIHLSRLPQISPWRL